MIINIRGTGGAGKSTIARAVRAFYPSITPEYIDGRRQPIGYRCLRPSVPPLYLVGHYETPTGGTDTISKPDDVYAIVRSQAAAGLDVFFEGIIVQDDTRRCIELHREHAVLVLALRVPIEVCLASIQARRDARGDTRPLDQTNTITRAKRLAGTMRKLVAAGVDARWVTRAEALATVLTTLNLPSEQVATADVDADTFQLT